MIVKVQITSDSDIKGAKKYGVVLIYNHEFNVGGYLYQGLADKEIRQRMNWELGQPPKKKYFFAHLKASEIILEGSAPGQSW